MDISCSDATETRTGAGSISDETADSAELDICDMTDIFNCTVQLTILNDSILYYLKNQLWIHRNAVTIEDRNTVTIEG